MLGVRKKTSTSQREKKRANPMVSPNRLREVPLPSEYGTYKTVKARFWHEQENRLLGTHCLALSQPNWSHQI